MKTMKHSLCLFAFVSIIGSFAQLYAARLDTQAIKQEHIEERWKTLKSGMSEKQVVSKLGKPRLIWRSSSECLYFYEEIPEARTTNGKKSVSLVPSAYSSAQIKLMKGCVKFYYGAAIPVQVNKEGPAPLPRIIKNKTGELVMDRKFFGGGMYFYREIPSPKSNMYRLEKGRFPDFLNMRLGNSTPKTEWDELSHIDNKEKWQEPGLWSRLPNKVASRGPGEAEVFPTHTDHKVALLLGQPHNKINSPGKMIWEYGDVDKFGRITFVQDMKRKYVLSEWAEPYWPDVEQGLSNPKQNTAPMQQNNTQGLPRQKENAASLPLWANKDAWLKMKMDMTQIQVEAILGKPDYIQQHLFSMNPGNQNKGVNASYHFYGLPPGHDGDVEKFPFLWSKDFNNGLVIFAETTGAAPTRGASRRSASRRSTLRVAKWIEPKYGELNSLTDYVIQERSPKRRRAKWEQPDLWKKLKPGLSSSLVERLLGSPHFYPDPTAGRSGAQEWRYGDVDDCGVLTFASERGKGLVLSGWSEPYWLAVDQAVNGGSKYVIPMPDKNDYIVNIFDKQSGWAKLTREMKVSEVSRHIGRPLSIIRSASGIRWLYDSIPQPGADGVSLEDSQGKPLPGVLIFTLRESISRSSRSKEWILYRWAEPDWSDPRPRSRVLGSEGYRMPIRPMYRWQEPKRWKDISLASSPSKIETLLGSDYTRATGANGSLEMRYGAVQGYGVLSFKSSSGRQSSSSANPKTYSLNNWKEPYWPDVENNLKKAQREIRPANHKIWQLTRNDFDDELPSVCGANVAWQASSTGFSQIFLFSNQSAKKISTGAGGHFNVKASERAVTWAGSSGLFLHSNNKTQRLSNTKPYSYQISGNRVIWDDNTGVFYYDGNQKRKVIERSKAPAISPSNIAWFDGNTGTLSATYKNEVVRSSVNGNPLKIAMSDETVALLCLARGIGSANTGFIRIHKWQAPGSAGASSLPAVPDVRGASANIYEGIGMGILCAYSVQNKYGPSVAGSTVTWIGDGYDVFSYDGRDSVRVYAGAYENFYPQTNGRCVVWQGHDGNDFEIFIYADGIVKKITNNEYDDLYPSLSKNAVAWQGWDGSDYEIFLADLR